MAEIEEKECPCGTCRYLDEVFCDCCHPKGGGAMNINPSLENCANKDWAWYEKQKSAPADGREEDEEKN